jgi:hypothetical protein
MRFAVDARAIIQPAMDNTHLQRSETVDQVKLSRDKMPGAAPREVYTGSYPSSSTSKDGVGRVVFGSKGLGTISGGAARALRVPLGGF